MDKGRLGSKSKPAGSSIFSIFLSSSSRKIGDWDTGWGQAVLGAVASNDDKLVWFYTGSISFSVFLVFFEFLGPVVEKLNYWGSKEGEQQQHRT